MRHNHWLIRRAVLNAHRDVIQQENRISFSLPAFTGCILSAVNLNTRMVITGHGMPFFRACLLPACFSLLLFLDRAVLPDSLPLPIREPSTTSTAMKREICTR